MLPKGKSPFGKFQSGEWNISLVNAFTSIFIWIFCKAACSVYLRYLLLTTKSAENLKLLWFQRQPPEIFCGKKNSWKISQFLQESTCIGSLFNKAEDLFSSASLLKRKRICERLFLCLKHGILVFHNFFFFLYSTLFYRTFWSFYLYFTLWNELH